MRKLRSPTSSRPRMDSVMAEDVDLQGLVEQLDTLYQNALDRLEAQTNDAIGFDRDLRRLLDQSETDESIVNWDPERAISPRLLYRSLALRLIKQSDAAVTRDVAISPMDYEDLLSWSDEPHPRSGNHKQDLLRRIQYARTKRLATFWSQFQARIAPDRDPVQARITALSDLLCVFAIEQPAKYIVPYSPLLSGVVIVPFALKRVDGDLDWVVKQETMTLISKANHALATICQLGQSSLMATLILEMNTTIHSKLRSSLYKYSPNEQFLAGGMLSTRLRRDYIDYRMSPELFSHFRASLGTVRGLCFIDSPRFH